MGLEMGESPCSMFESSVMGVIKLVNMIAAVSNSVTARPEARQQQALDSRL